MTSLPDPGGSGPLDTVAIAAWASAQPLFGTIEVRAEAGSSHDELVAAARAGAPPGTVLVVEHQTAGRGRRDRSWVSPPYAGLTFSMLLPVADLPSDRWGWVSLLAGVAVIDAVGDRIEAGLKWPNDVQVGPDRAKLAGILAEYVRCDPPAFALGIGLNVAGRDLPPGATSLLLQGADVDRTGLLIQLLAAVQRRFLAWWAARWDIDGLRAAYLEHSTTVGAEVDVLLPGEVEPLRGRAVGVDELGRLIVAQPGHERRAISAGDVLRVRPASPGTL